MSLKIWPFAIKSIEQIQFINLMIEKLSLLNNAPN